MAALVAFRAPDERTASEIAGWLTQRGLALRPVTVEHATRFGMKIGPVEATASELIQIVEAGPELVDSLFDAIERFRSRCRVFVNGTAAVGLSRQALLALVSPPIQQRGFKAFNDLRRHSSNE